MDNFKYKIKEANQPKVGDVSIENGTKYTIKSIDPDSGAIEWSVEKVANFTKVYKDLEIVKEDLDKLKVMDQAKNDSSIQEVSNLVTKAFNEYRTNLRKNYPAEFATVQQVSEESTTGGGVGQAGFTSGTSGDNYAAPIGYKYKLAKKPLKEADFDVNQLVKDQNITNPAMVDWISKRIESFDTLERQLNQLIPMLQQAKKETIRKYSQDPSFAVIYGTDLAQDYLQDIIELFKQPE